MIHFDANRQDANYPQLLRRERLVLGMTQKNFAKAVGYTVVMQGKYETERGEIRSAIPSEKTAKAIEEMVRKERAATSASSQQSSEAVLPGEAKPLKAITTQMLEQAIGLALSTLTGSRLKVEIENIGWELGGSGRSSMSLVVGPEPEVEQA